MNLGVVLGSTCVEDRRTASGPLPLALRPQVQVDINVDAVGPLSRSGPGLAHVASGSVVAAARPFATTFEHAPAGKRQSLRLTALPVRCHSTIGDRPRSLNTIHWTGGGSRARSFRAPACLVMNEVPGTRPTLEGLHPALRWRLCHLLTR